MELRHLRYFIAVAEDGSLTVAAEKKLHTAQPSLSRQIRDLEYEVGVQLMSRSVHGIELTAAGRAFLDHARLALTQAEAATEAARRAAQPVKPTFALGFLTGREINWLPEAMRVLHEELPNIEVTVSSQNSPDLADDLMRGRLDAAFMRPEERADELVYRLVITEPFVVVLPSDHRLAAHDAIELRELVGETFIIPSKTAPTSRIVIEDYLKRSGLDIIPDHEVDNITHAVSMIASTGAVALLPVYPDNLLPWSVTSRPIRGEAPTVNLVVGYHKANTSPILKTFLSKIDDMIARSARQAAQPLKPTFAMGFQTGQEVDWLPRATSILRDELLNIEIRVSSDHSRMLADDLQRGRLDVAFLRREQKPDLEYQLVAKEPLVVILPSDHPLAKRDAIDPHDLVGETFIGISSVPRALRAVISDYLKRCGIEIVPHLEIDNFAMAISLVASTRGVALLPVSAENFLKWSVISRPLKGEAPTIDLVVGYHKANTSPILRTFLSRIDDLTASIPSKARRMSGPGSAAAPR